MPYFSGPFSTEQLTLMRLALHEAADRLGVHEDKEAKADLARAVLAGLEQGGTTITELADFAVAYFMKLRGQ